MTPQQPQQPQQLQQPEPEPPQPQPPLPLPQPQPEPQPEPPQPQPQPPQPQPEPEPPQPQPEPQPEPPQSQLQQQPPPNFTNFATIHPTEKTFILHFTRGSVIDFIYPPNPPKSAIINAANEQCLGGGGVDGAINTAGGPTLRNDRKRLPILNRRGTFKIRCPTGHAVVTGPNSYRKLHVPYVIHAVGPNYFDFEQEEEEGDAYLRLCYVNSLECAKELKLEAVAFSLISSGVYSGMRSLKDVLEVGVKAICEFDGYEELKEVYMFAFDSMEARVLGQIALEMGSSMEEKN